MSVTVFGGGAVQTAYVSFVALDISANSITLVWPTSYFDVPSVIEGVNYDVLAASFTVTNVNLNAFTITLPNATESSVGSNFIVTNIGARPFQLLKSDGSELILIPEAPDTSNSFWVQLIDNSTPVGVWQFVQFGAGTSQAQAAALAGNGLISLGGILNTNIPVKPILVAPYQVLVTDRANLLLWQTGTGTMTLPLIATVPAGFYISVNNEYLGFNGILTIEGNVTIDNKPSIPISAGQSLSIISDGTKWWSLGFDENTTSSSFIPGSAISPSITFTSDLTTGIYYYNNLFPPVNPPGIGFTVGASQKCNITSSGLYMTTGNDITLQDVTSVAETKLISNASYGQILWNITGSPNPATLNITGTNTQSTLTLGPFGNLSFLQSDTDALIMFNGIGILFFDDTGASEFTNLVTFVGPIVINNTSTFSVTATFNGPAIFNDTVTLANPLPINQGGTGENNQQAAINSLIPGGAANNLVYYDGVIGWAPLATPLPIAIGGTGQDTREDAINALMPPGAAVGDLVYYDGADWILLTAGADGQVLTLAGGVPTWM